MTEQAPQETIMHWSNGRTRKITRRVNGKEHGRQQGWYENGQPGYDDNYECGKYHGRQQAWYKDGQPEYDLN